MTAPDRTEFYERRATLVRQAVEKRKEAENYREMFVGCAILYRALGEYRTKDGANWMLKKGGCKMCAEKEALLDAITDDGFEEVIAIVVVGNLQADDHSGRKPPTLHPCKLCRDMFQFFRLGPSTIILTIRIEGEFLRAEDLIYQEQNLLALLEYHRLDTDTNGSL